MADKRFQSVGLATFSDEEPRAQQVGNFESNADQAAGNTQVSEELAVELFAIVASALTRLGVSIAGQERALSRSRQLTTPPRVSGPLLRNMRGLSAILRAWSQEAGYLDADGRPRVLSIAGSGWTFQSLASRYLPGAALPAVVESICARAEVAIRPNDRIALLGGDFVNLVDSSDHVLAHGVRQIDQLLGTLVHNASSRRGRSNEGRMERMLVKVVTRAGFEDLMQAMRPHIGALLEDIESIANSGRPRPDQSLDDATAVSVGVYVSRDDDWERAGIDATSFANRSVENLINRKEQDLRQRTAPIKADAG